MPRSSCRFCRLSWRDSDITNLLGYESSLGKLFPDAVSAASVASLGSKSTSTGTGSIARSESISLVVAAIITQVLPNGNFVIIPRSCFRKFG